MFIIHQQLLKDCHQIGQIGSNHVLLHKNALLHWFILVPETSIENLLDMPSEELQNLMETAQSINYVLTHDLNYTKTNLGSLGNIVSQLHLHIIGRHEEDTCWPQPVWGNLVESKSYSEDQLKDIKAKLTPYLTS